eukprot:Skav203653  [mRNA]  locus=scaffold2755:29083:33826:+ [translate_table: standard]
MSPGISFAMDPIHRQLDQWGVCDSPAKCFAERLRVDMKVTSIEGGLVRACPIQPSVPCTTVICDFQQWVHQYVTCDVAFTILDFEIVEVDNELHVRAAKGELLPILHPRGDGCLLAEAFAGLGGWTCGLQSCGAGVEMMVEIDRTTANACADTHRCILLEVSEALELIKGGDLPTPCVIIGDIRNPVIHVIAGCLNIGGWLASPPCPPWSTASHQPGLWVPDGALLIQFLWLMGLGKVKCVMLENVPGLPKHQHFQSICDTIKESGMSLILAEVRRVIPVLPIIRQRWMATCVRSDLHVDDDKLMRAANISLPRAEQCFLKHCSIEAARCVQMNLEQWEKDQCVPDDDALCIMADPKLLPKNMSTLCPVGVQPEYVLQLRTKTPQQPLPNVMANQGSQHKLPTSLLAEKGLFAYLFQTCDLLRFTTPYEIASCMGFPATLTLPADFQLAWRMVGNSLSTVHSAWQYFRTSHAIGDVVGLKCEVSSNVELCMAIDFNRCQLQDFEVVLHNQWMSLVPKAYCEPVLSPNVTIIESPTECISDGDDEELPSPKRRCVSPTWEFQVDDLPPIPEPDVGGIDEFPRRDIGPLGTKSPYAGALMLASCSLGVPPADAIPVRLQHAHATWAIGFFAMKDSTVKEVFQHVFRFATKYHFDCIWVNETEARFGTKPVGVEYLSIVFQPRKFIIIVEASFLAVRLAMEVDIAWKFSDLRAYVAVTAEVLPSRVAILHNMKHVDMDAFVLGQQVNHFESELFPETCEPFVREPEVSPTAPMHSLVVPSVNIGDTKEGIRFTVQDPKWGSIRSIVIDPCDTCDQMLRKLIPTACKGPMPILNSGLVNFFPECLVSDLPSHGLEIAYPASGFPRAQVIHQEQTKTMLLSDPEYVLLWVKGPFDHRPKQMHVPESWTVLRLAARCMHDLGVSITMVAMQNGRGVDAKLTMLQLDVNATMEFRVCALPGGAKTNDHVASKLKAALGKRGVPEQGVAARAASIMAKIPHDEIATIFTLPEPQIWPALKKRANEAKVRMITSQELKDFQKSQRQSKADQSESSTKQPPKPKGRVDKQKTIDTKVTIDVGHFHAESGKLSSLTIGQWGPDMRGIAIASKEEASKLLPVTRLSLEPLALVVLTQDVFAGVSPVAVPAIDAHGRPTLTSVAILNFGDAEVSCRPQVPQVDLAPEPTAILEISIERSMVASWQEVTSPLSYLGVQLPELRQGKVIATWSFHPFDSQRKKCRHSDACYIHGYVKIPEECLHATLLRSGQGGVFINVRTSDKKQDTRYGAIALHGVGLEEAISKAKTIKNVLGVVRLGRDGPFGLRAKREFVSEVRRHALPQCITLQEGKIKTDSTMWTLRNVKTSTTCESLTAALRKLGWIADVIRPAGKDSWLAGAEDGPPATHLCIGADYVAVIPMNQPTGSDPPKTANALPCRANFSMCDDEAETNTACDQQIAQLASTVEDVQKDVASSAEATQQKFNKQHDELKAQLDLNNNTVVKQMQSLFSKMQADLKASLAPEKPEENESKRLKMAPS